MPNSNMEDPAGTIETGTPTAPGQGLNTDASSGPARQAKSQAPCPNCREGTMTLFYSAGMAPTNSVLRITDQAEAMAYPTGPIDLGICGHCGFIGNLSFDPDMVEYSERYESTLGFSPTFNRFHDKLVHDLIEKYDIRGKHIVEVGCGHGDFLIMLCEHGNNTGLGYDPAFNAGRHEIPEGVEVEFTTDLFTREHIDRPGDAFCCKMTLEHIHNTGEFVEVIAEAAKRNPGSIVFFQIPNAEHILKELAFWEVYYEHSSYFTKQSLEYLFHSLGLDVLETWTGYDEQFLMIAATPAKTPPKAEPASQAALDQAEHFRAGVTAQLDHWRKAIDDWRAEGKKIVLWGGSSRTVSFISSLDLKDEVEYIVDINPHRSGTYVAVSGHLIDTPDILLRQTPDVIIVMNPIYFDEIKEEVAGLGLSPLMVTM